LSSRSELDVLLVAVNRPEKEDLLRANRMTAVAPTKSRLRKPEAANSRPNGASFIKVIDDGKLPQVWRDDDGWNARTGPQRSPLGGAAWSHRPPFSS
jgi:hypothetical protein